LLIVLSKVFIRCNARKHYSRFVIWSHTFERFYNLQATKL